MRNASLWTKVAAVGIATVFAASCSKDSDNDSGGQAPAPVSAFVKKFDVNAEQGTCTILPGSNVEDATYECQVVVNDQAGEWQACGEDGFTFPAQAGADTKVKVKARTKGGRESEESLAQSCAVQGGQVQGDLVTEITDKNSIGQVIAAKDLTVTFAVAGADVDPRDIRYECKRESETAFTTCPLGNTYEFKDMIDGRSYSLEVRSVHIPTEKIGSVDGIAFQVKVPQIEIAGEQDLRTQTQGSVTLTWNNTAELGVTRITCQINDNAPEDCTNGQFSINIDSYPTGSNMLTVNSYIGSDLLAKQQIPFCPTSCNASGQVLDPLAQTMPIGKNYVYALPQNMYITQYAAFGGTSWASNVQFWRIANSSDPFYSYYRECGVNIIDQGRERLETRQGPNGPLNYCYSSMNPAEFKNEFNSEYAFNHVEAAATDDQGVSERVLLGAYDSNVEFNMTRSKFWKLCGGEQVVASPEIPLVNDYFSRFNSYNTWDRVLACYTHQNTFGSQERWYVGSFVIATNGAVPPWECFQDPNWYVDGHATFTQNYCHQFQGQDIIEVTYMARQDAFGFGAPYEFMGYMQNQFFNPNTQYRYYSQQNLGLYGPGLYQTRPLR